MRSVIAAVLLLACALPVLAADPPTAVMRITARYPGADARTVDETVLTPLFAKIAGVEGLIRIESEARKGTGTATLYFEPKADLNLAQVVLQNRVNLALPAIPAPCRQLGIQVRKFPAGPPAFLLALTSTDDKLDATLLGKYARVRIKSELAYLPGVVDVRVLGVGELGVRVLLNPDRLAAYRLTVGDVVDALRRQNAQVGAGGTVGGKERRFTVTASGRLTKVVEFENVILRANLEGEILRLKDVARVELGSTAGGLAAGGLARVNGKPAALIAVTAWPGRVTARQLLKIEAAGDLPPGMRFAVVADRAADRLLEVEVRLPDSPSLERTEKVVERATGLLRGLSGKPDTVAFAEGRTPHAATILVRLPAKGGPTATDVEKALAVLSEASIRVGRVQPGGEAFPVRLALTGPWEGDEEALREVADRVVAGLKKDPGVANPAVHPGPAAPHYAVNVDRDRCAMSGVKLDDIFTTLQASLGGVHATNFSRFGRMWPVTVQVQPKFTRHLEDLTSVRFRSATGEMVPLEKLLTIKKALAPPALVRVNGRRAIIVTAAPADGKTPAAVAALCVKLAQKILPRQYHVKDLTGTPR